MKKIGVLGAGSWGTALAILLDTNGHDVTVWSISQEEVDMLHNKREHESKLPGIKVSDDMKFTTSLEEAIVGMDILVLAVPSPFTRATAKSMAKYAVDGQVIVDVAKGIEDDTLMTLSEQILDEIPGANVAVLSGPSHAEEVGRGLATSVSIGARDRATAEMLRDTFMNSTFRVYMNSDILGLELGGSLKNVVALAAGIADGLGCGDNTKAALITRGVAEMTRLGVKMGGKAETFFGLSGIGDLIVTCSSEHSRNRGAGYLMGQGYTMTEATEKVQMVVEGVHSAKAALKLGKKYDVEMPLVTEVNKILFEDKSAKEALNDLMNREGVLEHHSLDWE